MKLAACFTVFNGLELLEKSVDNIRPVVDDIIICYQDVSNKGEYNPEVIGFLLRYLNEYQVHIIKYDTDLSLNTKENERRKHQMMIDCARERGNSHFIMMATDHFYHSSEVAFAKKFVQKQDYDATFTAMCTYYKHPTWQLTPIEDYFMPFICKLYPHTKIQRVREFPLRVDPSVQMNTFDRWHLFPHMAVMLHHYSMIRTDIENKFRNAAASIRWKPVDIERFIEEYETYDLKENPGISYFGGRTIREVPNYFGL